MTEAHRLPAAQYIRMSTEMQRYSLEAQTQANAAFAEAQGLQIVQTYADAGVSGVRMTGRNALKALLSDVLGGQTAYKVVLVLDVSRWGRFQDPDQSAHYEFICREAGVQIVYTGESFRNDGSLEATLVKSLKRAMAAEYSRELSRKVAYGKRGARLRGYWTGGPPGYALRRQMVSPDGILGPCLEAGEHKAVQGHKVRLVPGPKTEVDAVRRIFRLYAIHGMRRAAIADHLNAERILGEGGQAWTTHRVTALLKNEKYAGVLVGPRKATFLRRDRVLPRESWERVEGAVIPIVERWVFDLAQANLYKHLPRVSDEALLAELRALWAREGYLNEDLIAEDRSVHSVDTYRRRFGTLMAAYHLIGYPVSRRQASMSRASLAHRMPRRRRGDAKSDEQLLAQLRQLYQERGRLSVTLINDATYCSGADIFRRRFGGMRQAYARVGYVPSDRQELAMDAGPGQSLDRAQALSIRNELAAGLGRPKAPET